MPTYKTEAIIIRRMNFGEADRLVTAFSKDFGKVKFIAKGVRKTKSKMAGSIEPFCRVDLVLAKGRNLDTLSSAVIVRDCIGLEYDLEKIRFASFVAELIDKLTSDHIPNEELYTLSCETLGALKKEDNRKLKVYFLVKFLSISGILPELNNCIRCGSDLENRLYFSKVAGGVLDERCHNEYEDSVSVSKNTIKTLRVASKQNFAKFDKVRIPDADLEEVLMILNSFVRYALVENFMTDSI